MTGIRPRLSCDGEYLVWYDTDRAHARQMDAPDSIPAGSTVGRTPATPAGSRRCLRGTVMSHETNLLIFAA